MRFARDSSFVGSEPSAVVLNLYQCSRFFGGTSLTKQLFCRRTARSPLLTHRLEEDIFSSGDSAWASNLDTLRSIAALDHCLTFFCEYRASLV
mmetsp:Transcript_8753/g.29940  ORF Transcript_8753/g.29940 Transcript_8753/m.29940 type:complete len:93 (-) Transcript_8753:1754-2032(-)